MPNDIVDCPALHVRSKRYPARFAGKVPKTVRMRRTVTADPIIRLLSKFDRDLIARQGFVYPAWTNSHGAVCAVFDDGRQLGLKPDEFMVEAWHDSSA